MAKNADKSKSNPELVYVIAGKEQTLVNAKCMELIDQLMPPEEKATGLLMSDADKASISEVLDELRTLPFLTKRRVVVLRNADKFISAKTEQENEQDKYIENAEAGLSNREILEKYFESPCPTGILVLTVSSWNKNTRLAKMLPKVGVLYEEKPANEKELPGRLRDYAQQVYNKRLDYGAAQLLVELAGDNLPRLYTEVDKLAVYTADEKNITAVHIESLVGRNRFFDAFEVIDACLQRRPAQAVEKLRKMFEGDKSAEYTTIGAFAYHFRRLFNVKKMLDEGLNEYQITKRTWLGYNKDSQFALLKRLRLKQIGDNLRQLAETDYEIKRGQAQPRIAIEQLVLKMASL